MRHNADVTISESGGLLPRLGPYWSFPRCWAQEPPPVPVGFPVSPRELSFLQTLSQGSAEYGLVALL